MSWKFFVAIFRLYSHLCVRLGSFIGKPTFHPVPFFCFSKVRLFPTMSTNPLTPTLTIEQLLSMSSTIRIAKPFSSKLIQNSAFIQTYSKQFSLLFRDRYVFQFYFLLPFFSISGTFISLYFFTVKVCGDGSLGGCSPIRTPLETSGG